GAGADADALLGLGPDEAARAQPREEDLRPRRLHADPGGLARLVRQLDHGAGLGGPGGRFPRPGLLSPLPLFRTPGRAARNERPYQETDRGERGCRAQGAPPSPSGYLTPSAVWHPRGPRAAPSTRAPPSTRRARAATRRTMPTRPAAPRGGRGRRPRRAS